MAKASGTIDLKAMKEGHDDASTKATNYITEDETGINIHNTNDSDNYTHIDFNGMDIYQAGEKVADFGSDTLIGAEGSGQLAMDSEHIAMYTADGATAFEISASGSTRTQTISIYQNTPIGKYVSSSNYGTELDIDRSIQTGTVITVDKIVLGSNGTVLGSKPFSFTVGTSGEQTKNWSVETPAEETMTIRFSYVETSSKRTLRVGYSYPVTSSPKITRLTFSKEVDLPYFKTSGELFVEDHDSPIGTIIRDSFSKSISSGTTLIAMGANISMPAGSWVVNYSMRFPSNNTGRRGAAVGINGSNMASGYTLSPPVNGEVTALTGSTVTKQVSDWTLDFYARQNSGSAQTVTVHYDIIRIA